VKRDEMGEKDGVKIYYGKKWMRICTEKVKGRYKKSPWREVPGKRQVPVADWTKKSGDRATGRRLERRKKQAATVFCAKRKDHPQSCIREISPMLRSSTWSTWFLHPAREAREQSELLRKAAVIVRQPFTSTERTTGWRKCRRRGSHRWWGRSSPGHRTGPSGQRAM
jgi:hypothetical protein